MKTVKVKWRVLETTGWQITMTLPQQFNKKLLRAISTTRRLKGDWHFYTIPCYCRTYVTYYHLLSLGSLVLVAHSQKIVTFRVDFCNIFHSCVEQYNVQCKQYHLTFAFFITYHGLIVCDIQVSDLQMEINQASGDQLVLHHNGHSLWHHNG